MFELIIGLIILLALGIFITYLIKFISFGLNELRNYRKRYSRNPDFVKESVKEEIRKNFNGVALFHLLRQLFK